MSEACPYDVDDDTRPIGEAASKALQSVAPHRALTGRGDDIESIARRHWALAVEMGWPGIMVEEQHGGLGLGLAETAALVEQMGRQLFCGPFLASALVLPLLARRAATIGWAQLVREVARGEGILSLAVADNFAPLRKDGGLLSAACDLVEHPAAATHFLVLHLDEVDAESVELRAAVVPRAEATRIDPRQPLDVTCPVAAVQFTDARCVSGTMLHMRLASAELHDLLHPMHVALAAELVGIAQGALERTVAYAQERRQFGAVIGSFQAIKHRLADTAMLVANARLATQHAARGSANAISMHAARALATDAALRAAGDCIQVQGGLGFSWESDAHLYLKRARRVASVLGSAIESRRAVADAFIASVVEEQCPSQFGRSCQSLHRAS